VKSSKESVEFGNEHIGRPTTSTAALPKARALLDALLETRQALRFGERSGMGRRVDGQFTVGFGASAQDGFGGVARLRAFGSEKPIVLW
jgi:hypothetical protein